jgi:hypothetical protein
MLPDQQELVRRPQPTIYRDPDECRTGFPLRGMPGTRGCSRRRDTASHFLCPCKLDGLERQTIEAPGPFAGAGLWFVPVAHEGNRSHSTEEVERVAVIVELLTQSGSCWTDRDGRQQALGLNDIMIVAPYNDQVNRLTECLPVVGTVDRFQGQEAVVVIYSMATSAPEDAPRGMEFLYDLNRFNVATSRARCACIVVGCPRLFSPECRTPRQMELANVLCRYAEMSETVMFGAQAADADEHTIALTFGTIHPEF